MRVGGPGPHFDEDQGAVAVGHDEVHFARAAAGAGADSIIPLQQAQAGALQMRQRGVFRRVPARLGIRF